MHWSQRHNCPHYGQQVVYVFFVLRYPANIRILPVCDAVRAVLLCVCATATWQSWRRTKPGVLDEVPFFTRCATLVENYDHLSMKSGDERYWKNQNLHDWTRNHEIESDIIAMNDAHFWCFVYGRIRNGQWEVKRAGVQIGKGELKQGCAQ